ncbi:hypothetical protein BDV96DRAFT_257722 [Lophiotrema nucula]|uniref:Uncharacterized protein n=1 Tax=Lophiotrema nucula TaxID=690887 RepID=A0A6A5YQK8_9PLEO|nr:hypothetical protein BDV96DRAFT_257722 [Lophiotrema nucula]
MYLQREVPIHRCFPSHIIRSTLGVNANTSSLSYPRCKRPQLLKNEEGKGCELGPRSERDVQKRVLLQQYEAGATDSGYQKGISRSNPRAKLVRRGKCNKSASSIIEDANSLSCDALSMQWRRKIQQVAEMLKTPGACINREEGVRGRWVRS